MTAQPGTWIYPRLDPSTARKVLFERRGMDLSELAGLGALSHAEAAPAPTGGHPVVERTLGAVQEAVRDVASAAGYPDPLRGRTQTFDRPCGRELFKTMGIVTADAADEGVWSFVTLVVVPEIGPWRFPDMADDRMLGRPRNVLRRLWWRAWALGESLDEAPHGCAPLGEDESVQIMERPSLGGNQRTARALRDALWRAEAGGLTIARSEVMRQLARRLRAERSHLALDVLTDEALAEVIDDLAQISIRDLSRAQP